MVMNGFLFLSEMVQTAKVSLNHLFFIHYIKKIIETLFFKKVIPVFKKTVGYVFHTHTHTHSREI